MSVGPLGGLPASAAGSPLAQTRSSEVDRAQQEQLSTERRVQSDQMAENAAGVGQTNGEDHQAAERDADGRRLWEEPPQGKGTAQTDQPQRDEGPRSVDPSGQRGVLFDQSA